MLQISIVNEKEDTMINLITEYNNEVITLTQATRTIKNIGRGDLLKGMENMRKNYMVCECTQDFAWDWGYEIEAYNVLYTGFNKLFHGE
jgi:hypothetical protein|tara:strand:+ start:247 stop:513 length:267 start_codon:yes stop_codon:yes gene_type:complete